MQVFLKYLGIIAAFVCCALADRPSLQEIKLNGYAQGTSYTISYFATDSLVAKRQIDSILKEIDLSMSLYNDSSAIVKFNRAANGLQLDPHFAKVIKKAFEINQDTEQKFDVTVAPLVQLWGFGAKKVSAFPDQAAISNALACVGTDKLELQGTFLHKKVPCVQVDLNGIAQGYTVDVLADFINSKGIKHFMVELGGELRVKGPKPDGTPFKIGIEGPADDQSGHSVLKHVMSFTQGAVTTSGNYQKYIKMGKQTISHLIDPKTGYPLNNQMISVTVYAADALTADGYDNALMAMELKEALRFVAARKGLEAYFIYQTPDGKIADTLTHGFSKMLVPFK